MVEVLKQYLDRFHVLADEDYELDILDWLNSRGTAYSLSYLRKIGRDRLLPERARELAQIAQEQLKAALQARPPGGF